MAYFDGNSNGTMQLGTNTATPDVSLYAGTHSTINTNWAVGVNAVVTAVFVNASPVLRVNRLAATAGTVGASNAGGFCLGSGAGSLFSNLLVFEVLIFNVAHNTAQQNQIIQYLGNKWGIAV